MSSAVEATIAGLAAGDDLGALVSYLEELELDMGHAGLAVDASLGIYKVQLAAYLLAGQLDNARFLWKRIPVPQRETEPELSAIWAVGKAMWAKDHAATQGAITGFSWSPPLMGLLMERLHREHLKRCFIETAQAYSTISAEALSRQLGTYRHMPRASTDRI